MADNDLMIRIHQDDELAFKELFDKYYSLLINYAIQLLGGEPVVEEIIDDVLFNIWEKRNALEITSLESYLLRAVRNRCLNEMQSVRYRHEESFTLYGSDKNIAFLETLFKDDEHPLERLINSELEEKVEEIIQYLPNQCKIVFRKSRYEHKSYEDIATELGISKNTVKYHIKTALSILRNQLMKYTDIMKPLQS